MATQTKIHACPVSEGVRMQIGSATAFAVRKDGKDVALRIRRERHPLRDRLARVPLLRGMERLVGRTVDFLDGVFESAELEPQHIAKGGRREQRFAELFRIDPVSMVATGSAILAILLLGGLLLGLPLAVEHWILLPAGLSRAACNGINCALRLLGALACVALIPRLRVVNRFCMYRGAINKVLNTAPERDGRVRREKAQHASLNARRGDAGFIALTLLLSILGFALVRTYSLPMQLLTRAAMLLAVAGVLEELIRLLERLPKRAANAALAPLKWLERRFVREPHAQMVEVAVYAYNAAHENDK